MKKLLSQSFIFATFFNFLNAQTFSENPFNEHYHSFIGIAVEHYTKKEYQLAAENYSKAFSANGGGAALTDRIKLAGCWALCGNKDSAFKQLKMLDRARYSKYVELLLNTDFYSLHDDKRWTEITDFVKANRIKYNPQLNKQLVETLDTILENDQKFRLQEPVIRTTYSEKSKEMENLNRSIHYYDSINLIKVLSIIDSHGWPSSTLIGEEGSNALFLVLQHAELKTQEKYLSYIKTAVEQGNIPRSYLALLEDRIAVSYGKKQVYGTQIKINKKGKYCLEPLEDPNNVDQRRRNVGLSPLAEYLKQWDIEWPEKN